MKRFLFLICLLLFSVSSSQSETIRVYDSAKLFNEQETQQIEMKISDFRQKNKIDFAVLTTDDFIANSKQDMIATLFYQSLDLGIGKEKDGAVFYIDIDDRYAVLLPQGIFLINEVLGVDDISKIMDECVPFLSSGQYANSILHGIDSLQRCIDEYWEEQLN